MNLPPPPPLSDSSSILQLLHSSPASGTEVRLQVDLYPEKPLNPQAGINYLKFSIPGPVKELAEIVEEKKYSHPYWQALEKEVWPRLCLPDGIKVKSGRNYLYRAEINYLSQDKRPQPHQPPLSAAIKRTAEDLEMAKSSFQKLKTEHERDRVEKYQTRLDDLYTWQHLEKGFFDAAEDLALIESAPPVTVPEPAVTELATLAQRAANISLGQVQSSVSALESAQVSHSNEIPKDEGAVTMTQDQNRPTLPVQPEQIAIWQDVPSEHFSDPTMWMDRHQLKSQYGLSERSYFRWINTLKQHGLSRSLPSQASALLHLFYRPDIEQAIAQTQAAATQRRGRPAKGFITTQAPASLPQAQQPTAPKPIQSAPESGAEISQLADTLATLQKQQHFFEQTIAQLQRRIDSLAAQLQQQSAASEQLSAKDEILAAFDKLARKILRRTSAQLHPSPTRHKAKVVRSAVRPKAVKAQSASKQKVKSSKAKIKPAKPRARN